MYGQQEPRTDINGDYFVGDLATGTYRIGFFDFAQHICLSEWYDDAPDFWSATDIYIAAGQRTQGMNAELTLGGSISGRVTTQVGYRLSGVRVDIIEVPA